MYKSVEEVCSNCVRSEIPVFFFDTCSILDIINSLHSDKLSDKYAYSAYELMKLHGDRAWLITCQTVREEWNDNIESVLLTMEKEIAKTDRNISSMLSVSNLLLNASYPMPQRVSSLNMTSHIKSLSERFLDRCLHVERKDDHAIKAMQRVYKNEAPASKGKPEPKDCEIIESFLELCQHFRSNGFSEKLIFVTANKKDYLSGNDLKPPLDQQFSNVNAELITSIDHVLAIAKGLL